MQRHPVKRTVSHIDFLQVSMNESITVSVPLRLEGEAKAVVAANGLVDPAVDSVDVVTTPANMPNEFVVDITEMQPGDVIRLGDLKMPAGATAVGDPEMPIVTVLSLRAEEAVATADAEAAEEAADEAADEAAAEAAGEGSEPGAATDSEG
jgi:large subunit ribosomal protein L25